jgi:negative elongation factor C/D
MVHASQPTCILFRSYKLISDSGYEKEITSVAVASQQVEVYSKVLKTAICKYLEEGVEDMQKNLKDIIVCIYLFGIVWAFVLIVLIQNHKGPVVSQ